MKLNVNSRVVCFCSGGQVRSVSARHLLADRHGLKNVLSAGLDKNGPDTVDMLCRWADAILVVGDESLPPKVSAEHRGKVRWLNVGPDNYGHYGHAALLAKLTPLIAELFV